MSSQAPRFRVRSPSICLLICYVGQLPNWQNIQKIFPCSKKVGFFSKNNNSSPTDGFLQLQTPIVAAALEFFLPPPKNHVESCCRNFDSQLWNWRHDWRGSWYLNRFFDQAVLFNGKLVSSSSCQSMIGAFLLHVVFKPILSTLRGTNISPTKALLKMILLFPRWDMLVPWKESENPFQIGESCRKKLNHWMPVVE